ncbi:hypothetical protein [Micromonospora sp. NPDC005710]|uniref:hypothetical protein n=1 Tax=Micromonospora sp. NPDC005710 TaxID=3157051 RepID=UPI0033FDD807
MAASRIVALSGRGIDKVGDFSPGLVADVAATLLTTPGHHEQVYDPAGGMRAA